MKDRIIVKEEQVSIPYPFVIRNESVPNKHIHYCFMFDKLDVLVGESDSVTQETKYEYHSEVFLLPKVKTEYFTPNKKGKRSNQPQTSTSVTDTTDPHLRNSFVYCAAYRMIDSKNHVIALATDYCKSIYILHSKDALSFSCVARILCRKKVGDMLIMRDNEDKEVTLLVGDKFGDISSYNLYHLLFNRDNISHSLFNIHTLKVHLAKGIDQQNVTQMINAPFQSTPTTTYTLWEELQHILSDDVHLETGHLSQITCMTTSHNGKYVISCDRDEKVRVSHYPHLFSIANYCMAHTGIILQAKVLTAPSTSSPKEMLLTTAGDKTLRLWNHLQNNLSSTEDKCLVHTVELTHEVRSMDVTTFHNKPLILISYEGTNLVELFTLNLSHPSEQIASLCRYTLSTEPSIYYSSFTSTPSNSSLNILCFTMHTPYVNVLQVSKQKEMYQITEHSSPSQMESLLQKHLGEELSNVEELIQCKKVILDSVLNLRKKKIPYGRHKNDNDHNDTISNPSNSQNSKSKKKHTPPSPSKDDQSTSIEPNPKKIKT